MPSSFGSIESARVVIGDLVERYRANRDKYESSTYNEETARNEFINPLFEALGWDVANKAGAAEQYKDVIHEESIKVGDLTKAPDYTFRFGGVRKFFVEAKKPLVDLKSDPAPAFQLRRYAWSAKLPLSILTDFEEFAVYDTRIKPRVGDKASIGRVLYLTYDNLQSKLEEIWNIFSKDAVLKGSFDRYAETTLGKRGTSEVDAEFLKDIEGWREDLAKNLALRNDDLTEDDLNFAVQTTIDRIIFMRIAEGRGAEGYGGLLGLTNGPNIYNRLVEVYRKADHRYNSGLFDFTTDGDRLTPGLTIDDKVLKPILTALYYPQSPYEFSVLPAEILGNVYEQFLGKVIRLTKGHRAVIEEKPEVKKAGGVYYTPSSIVDYIVDQTVGALTEGKSPKQMEKLRILDPACGSGSFLIVAYQHLLDEHLAWYREHEPQKHKKEIFLGPGGWRLTTAEKRRILLNNIYGVDIDRQAVEVTKLSLLLKVMEGENNETLTQQSLFGERALPSLERNIKCGNSLIGSEFTRTEMFVDERDAAQVNPFDWAREFPAIIKAGGFDAIIGNPPYVNAWELFATVPTVRQYINTSGVYSTADRHWDLYVLFLERSLQLCAPRGRVSFIIPFSFAIQKYGQVSRRQILSTVTVESVADLRRVRVFGKVPVITMIPVIRKEAPSPRARIRVVVPGGNSTKRRVDTFETSHEIAQKLLLAQHESMWRLDLSDDAVAFVDKVKARSVLLGDLCYVNYGAQMSSKVKGAFGKERVIRDKKTNASHKPMISGRELYRYRINWAGRFVDWSLAPEMYGSRWPEFFELPKVMIRDLTGTHRVETTLDRDGYYCDHTVLCALRKTDVRHWKPCTSSEAALSAGYDIRFIAGVVASRYLSAYYYLVLTGEGVRVGGGFHTYPETIRQFPIPKSDQPGFRALSESVVKRVDLLVDLHRRLQVAKTEFERRQCDRRIATLDEEIDDALFAWYCLSEAEKQAVDIAVLPQGGEESDGDGSEVELR